jgi:hypothetical protein
LRQLSRFCCSINPDKVFGTHSTKSDYLYRAVIAKGDVASAITAEINKIDYPNFKDSIKDEQLHDAYVDVWAVMAGIQPLPPYSGGFNLPDLRDDRQ